VSELLVGHVSEGGRLGARRAGDGTGWGDGDG
jgi:hypothetical protein